MPFYPSADRDDGYDITDFYGVDPRLGTLGDFVEFIRTARDRGMRVIADLVVNHTSDQHPWFQQARSSAATRPTATGTSGATSRPPTRPRASCSPTRRPASGSYDEQAGQYYLHRFYKHQPDLNVANPQVRDEIAQIMGFWLQLGLSGLPGGRRAVPARDQRRRPTPRTCPTRTTTCATCAAFLSRRNGEARAARRGQPALRRPDAVLRRRRRTTS